MSSGARGGACRILVPLGLVVAVWASLAPRVASGPDAVRIAGSSWVGDAPPQVAHRLGLFDQGSPTTGRVEVEYRRSGRDALEGLVQGDVDFALAATTPVARVLLDPRRRTDPLWDIVVLASVALSNQSHYVVADRRSGIRAPEDLAGRRVGVMGGTSAHFALSRLLAFRGVSMDRVQLLDVPIDEQAAALANDRIDAAMVWEPWGYDLTRALGADAVVLSAREIHTVNWLLLTQRRTTTERPELVDRIVQGFVRAVDVIDREPERARELHAQAGGVPSAALAELEPTVIWTVGLDWSVAMNLEAQMDWMQADAPVVGPQRPALHAFLAAESLSRVAADRVLLPPYLLRAPRRVGGVR